MLIPETIEGENVFGGDAKDVIVIDVGCSIFIPTFSYIDFSPDNFDNDSGLLLKSCLPIGNISPTCFSINVPSGFISPVKIYSPSLTVGINPAPDFLIKVEPNVMTFIFSGIFFVKSKY